ncbi:MAG: F0F1 ATP synthase subunit A [Oscillospiraceae bacterium]
MPTALLLASESGGITVNGPLVVASFELFGITWNLTESIIVQWLVILILLAVVLILTHNMKVIPETRRQAAAEWIVEFFRGTVDMSMGTKYKVYQPYIAALFCFSLISSLMSLLGLRSPTADISVTGAWALITFVMIQYNRAKTGKAKGYFKSFIEPMPFMLPFNIIGEVANPVSLALRHFGNLVAGMVIGSLIYFALGNFAILVPAIASLYFDIFSAVMQAYIFIMLSMSYISSAECGD